ncbi:glycosyltransferase [Mannheimia granulomatis]|uniref:glycosyltransferase n=1 Tax=Mannheimia granulomatis TaxID=85402 RepID=UPI00047E4FD6|nr:glycosyltransferase [Mannheimia granulomatis]QLB18266.1 amylovoran biosynthesis protein AmsE [Mannheimia granulomatis]
MTFSILISLYYKEKPAYLEMCLDSLASQTLPANEIVVVFDGRIPEDLEKIVQKFAEKLPLVVVRLPQNIGLGRALNEGLKHCSNEWVLRMDTDDICLSERFEKQLAFIRNNPDVVLFSGQVEEFDETMSNTLGIKSVPITCEEIYSSALLRNPFNHMAVAYKKSVIEKVGGYQHHLYMEDYNLWLRVIAGKYKVYNLPDILVKVRSGTSMYARRKGLDYIKSEYQLAQLKRQLKLQSVGISTIYFIIRALPRLLPRSLLGMIYKKLRKG